MRRSFTWLLPIMRRGSHVLPFPASFPRMNSDWLRIGPETAYWVPRLAAKLWNLDTIYISENGTSADDKISADGNIYDLDRIMYLRNYLTQLQRAIAEGAPVRGYFLWSLMDNFEWIYRFRQAVRAVPRQFRDAGSHAEAQRLLLSQRHRAKCGGRLRRRRTRTRIREPGGPRRIRLTNNSGRPQKALDSRQASHGSRSRQAVSVLPMLWVRSIDEYNTEA